MNQATLAETRKQIREKKIRLPDHLGSRSLSYIAAYASTPFLLIGASVIIGRLTIEAWIFLLPVHFVLLLAAQRCMQTIVHDASHRLFSENPFRNDLVANLLVAGWIGSTVDAYRKVHFKHHAHNGSKDDPEHIDFDSLAARGGLPAYCVRYILCFEAFRLFRKYYLPEAAADRTSKKTGCSFTWINRSRERTRLSRSASLGMHVPLRCPQLVALFLVVVHRRFVVSDD